MSVFSQTRGTLVSEPASWWELVREDGSQILKTWVKSPHIFERALVLIVFQTKSVLGWGDSRKAHFNSPSASGLPVPDGVCSLFPKPLFPLFWGLNALRLADSFQNLLKGVDCLSRNYTHTRHPPPLPTSLTHIPLSFPSFLHSLSYTFTSSLEQKHWFCIQFHSVGRLRGASWVTSPLDPRTVLLRARNRVLGPNPLLGMDRKMLKLSCLPWGDPFHMCHKCHHPTPITSVLGVRGPGSRAQHT